jgi:hypothetical protein
MNTIPAQQVIRSIVSLVPQVFPLLGADGEARKALKAAPGYDGIRNTYFGEVFDAVYDYLVSDRPVTSFRASMQRAMVQAFGGTVDLAYADGGGELPLDEDTLAWYNEQVSAEMGHIEDLFNRLKAEWENIDPAAEAEARATGYVYRLDALYAEAKMRGGKNKILYWHLGRTEKHCRTCASLDGQGHKISWYIDHNYIPRKPYASMECGGFRCDCTLTDKNGNEYTP